MRVFLPVLFLIAITACRKQTFTNSADAMLATSVDTLHFDTVFTTTGSTTQFLKIFNNNSKGIHINSVKLLGGAASPFKINVDGMPGPQVTGVAIAGNDSAYVFVTVSINPSAANLPFVVRDSLAIEYNGHIKKVQLEAYGQNAHFLRGHLVLGTEVWTNDLPYVVLDGLLVARGAQLTIDKGCKIYAHADAPIIIDGTLTVRGQKWDSTKVIFTGDRLDAPYNNFPASWPGILFTANSRNNSITYGIIKNAYQAIVLQENVAASPVLALSQTVIDNAYDAGITAINSSVAAQNVLISNCAKNIVIEKGGNYNFTHCTIASYSNNFIQHKQPVVSINNFINQNNTVSAANLTAVFRNCIIWGESGGLVKNEVAVNKSGNTTFAVTFDGVLWPLAAPPANTAANNAIASDPQFVNPGGEKKIYDFHLKETSPAINKGVNTGVTLDLDGNPRPVNLPDLGAYEKQ